MRRRPTTRISVTDTVPAVAPLVHATVQELVRRAAHDVRNLMNGVAVNLEVARTRSGRPGADAAKVHPFAELASQQFELLCAITEALLTLARPPREPCDLAREWSTFEVFRAMLPLGDGRAWVYDGPADGGAPTTVVAEAARLALAASLLAALDAAGDVHCTIRVAGDIEFTVSAKAIALSDDVVAALSAAGIGARRAVGVITLTFPTRVA